MSLVLDDPDEYKKNPLYNNKYYTEYGDYTAFYVTIAICTVFGFGIFLLNIFFCWCSKHRDYWQDGNTGNRWIIPIWTKGPTGQTPLDLTELEADYSDIPRSIYEVPEEYIELHQPKRESEI